MRSSPAWAGAAPDSRVAASAGCEGFAPAAAAPASAAGVDVAAAKSALAAIAPSMLAADAISAAMVGAGGDAVAAPGVGTASGGAPAGSGAAPVGGGGFAPAGAAAEIASGRAASRPCWLCAATIVASAPAAALGGGASIGDAPATSSGVAAASATSIDCAAMAHSVDVASRGVSEDDSTPSEAERDCDGVCGAGSEPGSSSARSSAASNDGAESPDPFAWAAGGALAGRRATSMGGARTASMDDLAPRILMSRGAND